MEIPVPGDINRLVELISDIRVAFMLTAGQGPGIEQLHARPMYTQRLDSGGKPFDGTLWFLTDAGSAKVREIEHDAHVVITYADAGKNKFAVVRGTARSERNPEKAAELWNVHAKGWYPGGPDDPKLVLLRVAVASAEYWDGPSNVSYFIQLAKAIATGERNKAQAEHGTVGHL